MCRCVFSLVFGFERGVNVGIKGLGQFRLLFLAGRWGWRRDSSRVCG